MKWPRRASYIGFLVGVLVATLLGTGHLARTLWSTLQNQLSGAAAPVDLEPASLGAAVFAGTLEDPRLDEASGLAVSQRSRDLLWVVNDSGAEPVLHALGLDGSDRGSVRIQGVANRDWEGLVSFEHDGTPYLLVGDVGDNFGVYDEIHFFGVAEPVLTGERFEDGAAAPIAFRVDVRYEDGARDAEAFDFDIENRRILLLSKRTVPPQLYEIPLTSLSGVQASRARKIGIVDRIPAPTARELEEGNFLARYRSQPTSLDLARDGRSAVVLTYGDAYEFAREPGEAWEEALAREPQRISLPPLAQSEAAGLDPANGALWVTSEGRPAPLFRLPHQKREP